MMQETWRINLFGSLQAQSEQRTLNGLAMRRVGALLACLMLRAPHPVPREELLALLWPDEPTDIARNRLRVLLNTLRQHLEPEAVATGSVLLAGRQAVCLSSERFTSDYNDFLEALQSAKTAASEEGAVSFLEQALACYRGELLVGFYDEWILVERRRLADLRYQALRALVRRLMPTSASESAIEYARQAVAIEPLDEEAHTDLMRLYVLQGQPSAALRQYAQLKRLLQEEMNAEPSASAKALALQIEADMGHGVTQTKRHVRPMTIRASEAVSGEKKYTLDFPPRLTRFFGREEESALLKNLLSLQSDVRLVTLLGIGGIGKTRLAQEIGEALAATYEGRVLFVSLAECTNCNHISARIARAMRLSPVLGLDTLSQVMAALQPASWLVILDNLEQLLPDASPLIEQMLLEAPLLRCLLTSRRSAGIEGEQEIALGSLPAPDANAGIEELMVSPGVALFLDRVRAVRFDFALTAANAADVVALCKMLEGLPLAIELAAARARVMTPAEMKNQTGQLLDWLVDIRGGKTARHRSIRAALEWSFRLLSVEERRFFSALAVFTGGFTAHAAAAIALGEGAKQGEALALLERLRDASLLTPLETEADTMRFGLLETLREFGLERLKEGGTEAETRRRHLAYFAGAWWEQAQSDVSCPRWDAPLRTRAEAEESNFREALAFGLREEAERSDQQFGLRLASRLIPFWEIGGRWQEGKTILLRASRVSGLSECRAEQIKLLQGAGLLANLLGDYEEARSLSARGLSFASETGDVTGSAGCLFNLGTVAFYRDDYAGAQQCFEQALELYRRNDEEKQVAACLVCLGNVAFFVGDHEEAKVRLHAALDLYRRVEDEQGTAAALLRLGNVWRDQAYYQQGQIYLRNALEIYRSLHHRQGIATCLHDLGLLASFQSETTEAGAYYAEALEQFQAIGSRRGINACLYNLGSLALDRGDYAGALAHYEECLSVLRKIGDRRNMASCLLSLGNLALDQEHLEEAAQRYSEALAIEREINSRGGVANAQAGLGWLAIARHDLSDARWRLSEALAIYEEMGIQAGVVLMLEAHAELASHKHDWKRAAALVGAASRLRAKIGYMRYMTPRRWETALANLRAELAGATWISAFQHGETMPLSEAIAEALR